MFRIATLCVVLYCSVASAQQVDSPQGASAVVEVIKFDFQQFYSSYSKILDKYVDLRGRVDYLKLKENHLDLDSFVESLKKLSKTEFDSWEEKEKIALWVNAYNALTLKVVVDNYPIKPSALKSAAFPSNSIRQIVGAWTGFKHEVMGRSLTLDEIANTILRNDFKEPRFHLAVCPAAVGAAMLRREVYLGTSLDSQLASQAKYFFIDPAKFYLDQEGKQVLISPIFDWYASDFVKLYPELPQFKRYSKEVSAILQFVTTYLAEDEAGYIKTRPLKVSFLEFDWNLNDQEPSKSYY